jgi:hypothetical protein
MDKILKAEPPEKKKTQKTSLKEKEETSPKIKPLQDLVTLPFHVGNGVQIPLKKAREMKGLTDFG